MIQQQHLKGKKFRRTTTTTGSQRNHPKGKTPNGGKQAGTWAQESAAAGGLLLSWCDSWTAPPPPGPWFQVSYLASGSWIPAESQLLLPPPAADSCRQSDLLGAAEWGAAAGSSALLSSCWWWWSLRCSASEARFLSPSTTECLMLWRKESIAATLECSKSFQNKHTQFALKTPEIFTKTQASKFAVLHPQPNSSQKNSSQVCSFCTHHQPILRPKNKKIKKTSQVLQFSHNKITTPKHK